MPKVMYFNLRLNADKLWDKVIMEYLEKIPPGHRASQIKRILYEALTSPQAGDRPTSEIESKLDSMFGDLG